MSDLNRITLVEDEEDIRTLVEMALGEMEGFELDLCTCGPHALERVPVFRPDLILLDVMMPGMDGPEVAHRLAQIDTVRHVPIVFMTAKTRRDEVSAYLDIGALAVIPKPFDPMKLGGQLRNIWETRE